MSTKELADASLSAIAIHGEPFSKLVENVRAHESALQQRIAKLQNDRDQKFALSCKKVAEVVDDLRAKNDQLEARVAELDRQVQVSQEQIDQLLSGLGDSTVKNIQLEDFKAKVLGSPRVYLVTNYQGEAWDAATHLNELVDSEPGARFLNKIPNGSDQTDTVSEVFAVPCELLKEPAA